jgi:CubicO group peptidase (beta-lactamase class C family)
MAPAGQLWSTVEDLSVLGRFLLGDSGDVLSADTVSEMAEPGAMDALEQGTAYGLGLQILSIEGRKYVGHTGSVPGFLAGIFVDPQERSGAIALANATSGLGGGLTTGLLKVLRELEPRVVDAWSPRRLPDDVDLDLLGPWYWGPTPYALHVAADGRLQLNDLAGAGRAARFRALGEGRWVGLNGYFAGEVLTVGRDAADRVTQINVGSFTFTRTPYDPDAPVPGGVDSAGWQ